MFWGVLSSCSRVSRLAEATLSSCQKNREGVSHMAVTSGALALRCEDGPADTHFALDARLYALAVSATVHVAVLRFVTRCVDSVCCSFLRPWVRSFSLLFLSSIR